MLVREEGCELKLMRGARMGLETWLFLSKTLSVTLCLTFVRLSSLW